MGGVTSSGYMSISRIFAKQIPGNSYASGESAVSGIQCVKILLSICCVCMVLAPILMALSYICAYKEYRGKMFEDCFYIVLHFAYISRVKGKVIFR